MRHQARRTFNQLRNWARWAIGSRPIVFCSCCSASHLNAGPFVEGPEKFFICDRCMTEAKETEVSGGIASGSTQISSNPYLAPTANDSALACALCGNDATCGKLYLLSNRHFACEVCVNESRRLFSRAGRTS